MRVKKRYESKIERMRVNNKCVVASLGDWLLLGQEQRAEKKRWKREGTRVRKYSCGESEKEKTMEKEARECRSEHNTFNKFKVITIKNY